MRGGIMRGRQMYRALGRRPDFPLEPDPSQGLEGPFTSGKEVNKWVFDFVKTFLHALYGGALNHTEIKVDLFHALASPQYPAISKPRISFKTETGLVQINDDCIHSRVSYAGAEYYISLIGVDTPRGIIYNVDITGFSGKANRPDALRDLLIEAAINNSMYQGRILRVIEAPAAPDDEDPMDLEVEIVKDLENAALADIFLPAAISKELRQFIECVTRYEELGASARYLLSGPPGTAKTQIVRSIAKACEGKATIILASGGDSRLNMLFSFASIFRPAILCIDDIDLVVGDRSRMSNKSVLGTFLQKLDGFTGNHVFVLATTNDKAIVDLAASRPGRFDQVIDVGALEPRNYVDLVKRRTTDPEIISLFEHPEVIDLLREKQVVGSFLANLVKHAVMSKLTNGHEGLTKAALVEIINRTYRGFYQDPQKAMVGFSTGF